MNICLNCFSSFRSYFDFTIPSLQQIKIGRVFLAIFSAALAVFVSWTLNELRQRVTVIDEESDCSYSTHIRNVNGKVKVIFSGVFASGATAEGDFVNGQLNGKGKISFVAGEVKEEEGNFVANKLLSGQITKSDGTVEVGTFDGKRRLNGSGKRVLPDQTVQVGNFHQGNRV